MRAMAWMAAMIALNGLMALAMMAGLRYHALLKSRPLIFVRDAYISRYMSVPSSAS